MGAANPAPAPDDALDEVLANIDRLADHVQKKATQKRKSGDTPSGPLEVAKFKRTRAAFQAMSETQLDMGDSSGTLPAIVLPAEETEDSEEPVSVLKPTTWFPKARKHLG